MSLKTLSFTILLTSAFLSTGCALAKRTTAAEDDIITNLNSAKFQPAARVERDNIETQDILAQAAFWSNEHNLNPGDLEAAIKLAAAVRKMGNAAQAVEITQQTRALYPSNPYLLAEHSAALISAGRAENAIEMLNMALKSSPNYARLWSLKGVALDQIEQYNFARQHYDRALKLTPDDPNILANIGLSHALAGDAVTAEIWLRNAVNHPRASQGVRQNLAIVLQLQGKDREAQTYLPYEPSNTVQQPAYPAQDWQNYKSQNPAYQRQDYDNGQAAPQQGLTRPTSSRPANGSHTINVHTPQNHYAQNSYPQNSDLQNNPPKTASDMARLVARNSQNMPQQSYRDTRQNVGQGYDQSSNYPSSDYGVEILQNPVPYNNTVPYTNTVPHNNGQNSTPRGPARSRS